MFGSYFKPYLLLLTIGACLLCLEGLTADWPEGRTFSRVNIDTSDLPGDEPEDIVLLEERSTPPEGKEKEFFEKLEQTLLRESELEGPYRLRVGDTLRVSIYGEANTERVLTVDSHGEISYLLIGRLLCAGKTIDELKRELNEKMRQKLRYALVDVVPVNFGGRYYTILGQILDPGKKPIIGETTLLEALAAGGSLRMGFFRHQTVDLAELRYAFLARNGNYVPIDFYGLVAEGDLSQNVVIEPNDFIYIPTALNRTIYVLGEVNLPANIGHLNQETLLGAVAKARGFTALAGSHAYILRGSLSKPQKIVGNVHKMLRGEEKDILLKPGDIVYVPPRGTTFLEEIVMRALRGFVLAISAEAGRESFEELHPHADEDDTNIVLPP